MVTYNNFDLSNYNSYRIKASCCKAHFPHTESELLELFSRSKEYVLLGSGHNVILAKEHYDQEFIIFNGNFDQIDISAESGLIAAESGVMMKKIAELACENSLSGVEVFYDIPSSLGGAVVMNAGASGEEIKDVLIKVRYLDLADMQVKVIHKDDMGFEYRNSFFQKNKDKIVLKAWLQLIPKEMRHIREKMEIIKSQRWAKQPKEFPNAGSVFKRPSGFYVGAIIDQLGLKGYTVGGAKISEKHGGFIVNFDNAKGTDILRIIEEVKKRAYETFGIILEVEQRVI